MSTETGLFWLIHLFIGVVVPVMTFLGCCKEQDGITERVTIRSD